MKIQLGSTENGVLREQHLRSFQHPNKSIPLAKWEDPHSHCCLSCCYCWAEEWTCAEHRGWRFWTDEILDHFCRKVHTENCIVDISLVFLDAVKHTWNTECFKYFSFPTSPNFPIQHSLSANLVPYCVLFGMSLQFSQLFKAHRGVFPGGGSYLASFLLTTRWMRGAGERSWGRGRPKTWYHCCSREKKTAVGCVPHINGSKRI